MQRISREVINYYPSETDTPSILHKDEDTVRSLVVILGSEQKCLTRSDSRIRRMPVCLVCNKFKKVLNAQHLATHNLTREQYLALYPDACMYETFLKCRISVKLKGISKSEETKDNMSDGQIRAHARRRGEIVVDKDPKGPTLRTGLPHSQETRSKMSASAKGLVRTPETCAKIALGVAVAWHEGRLKSHKRNKPTKWEIILSNLLDEFWIEHQSQFRIGRARHRYDECLPTQRIIVELDGCYYHRCDKNCHNKDMHLAELDKRRTVRAEACGYKVIRIAEHDTKGKDLTEYLRTFIYKILTEHSSYDK